MPGNGHVSAEYKNLHKSVICFSKSFRILSFELSTFLTYTFQKKTVKMNHPDHFFFCLKKYVFSMVDSCLSCPYPVSAQIFLSMIHLFLYLSSIPLHYFLYLRLLHKHSSRLFSENKTKTFPGSYIPLLEIVNGSY